MNHAHSQYTSTANIAWPLEYANVGSWISRQYSGRGRRKKIFSASLTCHAISVVGIA